MTLDTHTLAILGYGRFGAAIADLAESAGLRTLALDTAATIPAARRADSLADLAQRTESILLAVPVPEIPAALRDLAPHLTPRHLILDAGSVKLAPIAAMRAALGTRIPWIGTHPLFGPVSLARNERPRRVVVCPNDQHPDACARARALYERLGCDVIEQDADAHDRLMAETHALAFLIAKGLIDIRAGEDAAFVPPSFHAMRAAVDAVRADAGHLFSVIQRDNPHAPAARRALLDALERIHHSLEGPTPLDIPPP
ncbi:MAG TPA: prephenate dehydrogenase/arogenate dehydrogenase family protein [Phycisphaerales bacterium]|nr:prephenate dehydrogenase/arogenate dehydrogenase family protein [Phycisphaerales bacterium]